MSAGPAPIGLAFSIFNIMAAHRPLIGIPADRRVLGPHAFHAVGEKYIQAVTEAAQGLPWLIPVLATPVDAHELLALCAPRLTFVSYGVPEKGDAKWLDQQGSYMAAVASEPVFRLLGAKDLGVKDDYHTAKMPPVNTSLLDGQLAWRQHDGGHTDAPNWKYFIPWADRFLRHDGAAR